ncbi:MAG TPA: MraY family glycosyltransferase [Acidimicrobiia bacterium]|nr:MraY family glycosyltransferase [Acidimicrobiia bacterium]
MAPALVAFAVSLGVCAAFVRLPVGGRLLTRGSTGLRWRMDSVPVAGGLGMGAGFGVAVILFGRDLPSVGALCVAGYLGLAVGLWDDVRPMSPVAKLAGQVAAGVTFASLGATIDLPGPDALAWVVTVGWVVVATNAVNLLDNMDGVAAGCSLVAAVALFLWWSVGSGPAELAAGLGGAVGGFLVLNFPPARLFMGDSGSHFMGTLLAGLTIIDGGRAGSSGDAAVFAVLLVPALVLAVPLFDTALVTVERLRHGRPVWEGGRDHTAHRLERAGLGVRSVVTTLWAVAAATAGAATLAAVKGPWLVVAALAVAVTSIVAWRRLAAIEA